MEKPLYLKHFVDKKQSGKKQFGNESEKTTSTKADTRFQIPFLVTAGELENPCPSTGSAPNIDSFPLQIRFC